MNEGLLKSLTLEGREWAKRHPELIEAVVKSTVEKSIKIEREREQRRKDLLTLVAKKTYYGGKSFGFSDFLEKGKALVGARVRSIEGGFPEWFSQKQEEDIPYAELLSFDILPGSVEVPHATDPEIRERIGHSRLALYLAHVCYFLESADQKPWYCFYANDVKGVLRKIHAEWWDWGWYISASAVGYSDELRNGGCVVSR